MRDHEAGQVTLLLARWKAGDDRAFDDLLPLVYAELRGLAATYLARERRNHTLQPTALVHEAYLRLARVTRLDVKDRAHFFAVAARALRRILVDHARKQAADKRVGAHRKRTLSEDLVGAARDPAEVLDVHRALFVLERRHPRAAKLVELRFFGGLSENETAAALALSRATMSRDWRFARLWLHDHLGRKRPHNV